MLGLIGVYDCGYRGQGATFDMWRLMKRKGAGGPDPYREAERAFHGTTRELNAACDRLIHPCMEIMDANLAWPDAESNMMVRNAQ